MVLRTVAAIAAALGGAAHAQTPPAGVPAAESPAEDRVVYETGFFSAYAPQTALDMVRRVPGFSIDNGADRRGFSGAAGNVLIDGARPSAKSQSLDSILDRIPASQVARIELIRAASTGEAAGQAVLVNVVRNAAAGGGSGAWEVELERSQAGRVTPRGSGSYTGRIGPAEYTLGASRFLEQRPLRGYRYQRNAGNALTAVRTDFTPRTFREASGNGQISFPLFGGKLNANFSAERWNFATDLESAGYTPSGVITDSFRLSIDEREREREIGGDYERRLGPLMVKLVGLDTRRWYANDERTLLRNAAFAQTGLITQRSRHEGAETIGRVAVTWPISDSHRVEFGAETALNSLETGLALAQDGVPIILPSANVTVEEDRTEGFALWTWKPAARWSLESGVTVETSTISQSGDTSASRTLTYWKPSLQASRQFGTRDQVRVKAFRDVSQLDFEDFASSAELADDAVAAGNPDLRPQATWRLEGVLDKRFGEKGALTLTLAREWIEDASDLIPIFDPASGRFFDAPGNIGDGRSTIVQAKTTLPLGGMIPGGQVEAYVSWVDTQVTDPTTGRERQTSGNSDLFASLSFRQDLTVQKLAWGMEIEKASQRPQFRVAEYETFDEGPFLDAFVETTRYPGIKIRVFGNNLLDSEFVRKRRFFAPNRAGAFSFGEERERQFGRFVGIEVSGNF